VEPFLKRAQRKLCAGGSCPIKKQYPRPKGSGFFVLDTPPWGRPVLGGVPLVGAVVTISTLIGRLDIEEVKLTCLDFLSQS
jgi:hypothetical protein